MTEGERAEARRAMPWWGGAVLKLDYFKAGKDNLTWIGRLPHEVTKRGVPRTSMLAQANASRNLPIHFPEIRSSMLAQANKMPTELRAGRRLLRGTTHGQAPSDTIITAKPPGEDKCYIVCDWILNTILNGGIPASADWKYAMKHDCGCVGIADSAVNI